MFSSTCYNAPNKPLGPGLEGGLEGQTLEAFWNKMFQKLDTSGPSVLHIKYLWAWSGRRDLEFPCQCWCFCARPSGNPAEFQDTSDHHTFKKMLPRDERRFKAADLDSDQTATREEFTAFLHPEEFEHMKEIVVLVSYPKSLNWEAAPKPYPFLQSENVLQPKGNWTRTLQWNTLEGLCTQEMSQGRVAAITSSPQSQLFNTITES